MPNKKSSPPKKEHPLVCSFCGKDIIGDHIYIQTRRRTQLHICPECWRKEWNNETCTGRRETAAEERQASGHAVEL